jgi:hypothetical protein
MVVSLLFGKIAAAPPSFSISTNKSSKKIESGILNASYDSSKLEAYISAKLRLGQTGSKKV